MRAISSSCLRSVLVNITNCVIRYVYLHAYCTFTAILYTAERHAYCGKVHSIHWLDGFNSGRGLLTSGPNGHMVSLVFGY